MAILFFDSPKGGQTVHCAVLGLKHLLKIRLVIFRAFFLGGKSHDIVFAVSYKNHVVKQRRSVFYRAPHLIERRVKGKILNTKTIVHSRRSKIFMRDTSPRRSAAFDNSRFRKRQ